MFFTKLNCGKVQAIYTGRFAYLLGLNASMARKQFSTVVRDGNGKHNELTEEYQHFRLYMRSLAGLYINGLRWVVRVIYSVTNSSMVAKDYYKARSIFFGMAYRFHEDQVNGESQSLIELARLDIRIIARMLFVSRIALLSFALFPLVVLVGMVISAHFTTRICDAASGSPKVINISKFGYVGLDSEKKTHPLIVQFGKVIQIETYFRDVNHFRWMHSKALAEREMWDRYGSDFHFGCSNTFEEYVRQYVRFVEHWFGMTGITPITMIRYLLKPGDGIPKDLLDQKEALRYYAWFAYAHGN